MDASAVLESINSVTQLIASMTLHLNAADSLFDYQKEVLVEGRELSDTLSDLSLRIDGKNPGERWLGHVEQLGGEYGPLKHFERMLRGRATWFRPSGIWGKGRDLVPEWRLGEEDATSLLREMKKISATIRTVLDDNMPLELNFGGHIDDFVRYTLSRWLRVHDSHYDRIEAGSKSSPGSGTWLLGNPVYKDWFASPCSILWLYGGAGCGKSVLSATIFNCLARDTAEFGNSKVMYFSFHSLSGQKRKLQQAVRALLFQCIAHPSVGTRKLADLFQSCDKGRKQPDDVTLQSMLLTFLGKMHDIYIVFDGIDGCPDEDMAELFAFVKTIASKEYRARVLVTSRPTKGIDTSMRDITDRIINFQNPKVGIEIRCYIEWQLPKKDVLEDLPEAIRIDIEKELVPKASGTFGWVKCQLDILQQCTDIPTLQHTLYQPPISLDETFSEILKTSVTTDSFRTLIMTLQWLCYSYRPIQLSELLDILAIKPVEYNLGGLRLAREAIDSADILEMCPSLIDHSRLSPDDLKMYSFDGGASSMRAGSVWVKLALSVAREYLTSDRCFLPASFIPGLCHANIGVSCLWYLKQYTQDIMHMNEEKRAGKYPLAHYAARYCWQHLYKAEGLYLAPAIKLIKSFFKDENNLLTWIRLYDKIYERDFSISHSSAQAFPAKLYYHAHVNDDYLMRALCDKTHEDFSMEGGFNNVLVLAAARDHQQLVSYLLERGVDVNQPAKVIGENAIQAAARNANQKLMRTLIEKGADILSKSGWSGDIPRIAAFYGREQIMHMVLQMTTKPDVKLEWMGAALEAASTTGSENLVNMLFENGADMHVSEAQLDRALVQAAESGRESLVRLLLRKGADVNSARSRGDDDDGNHDRPLSNASAEGHADIVRLLIDEGADVNAQGGDYDFALVCAAHSAHEKVVQILLDNGADVNAKGPKCGRTALQEASFLGHERVVEILLDNGAELHATGQSGTALEAAMETGQENVVRILMRHGADINSAR